jgi:hypothetical protein
MDHLLLTTVQTAGIVIAACIVVDFVIIRLVRYGKIKRLQRKSVTSK